LKCTRILCQEKTVSKKRWWKSDLIFKEDVTKREKVNNEL